jgi:hypothetical protein
MEIAKNTVIYDFNIYFFILFGGDLLLMWIDFAAVHYYLNNCSGKHEH